MKKSRFDQKHVQIGIALLALVALVLYLLMVMRLGDPKADPSGKLPAPVLPTQVLSPLTQEIASTGKPAEQALPPADSRLWENSFQNLRAEKPRVVVHRAAASGKLSDVVAARWQQQFCSKFSKDVNVLLNIGIGAQAEQIAYFKKMQQSCFADSVQASNTLRVRDDQGFGRSAIPLAEAAAGNAIPDSSTRRELLKRVLETESLDLLAAVSRRVLVKEDIYDLGLIPSKQIDGVTDEIMLDLAVQIQSCIQRGDCDSVALENIDCDLFKSCVKDLRDFPSQRIFGDTENRTFFTRLAQVQDADTLRSRWSEINQFLQTLRHSK